MSLVAQKIERSFSIKIGKEITELKDLNENFTVEEVMEMYTMQYPQLVNATIINKGIVADKQTYEFETIAGTKG